MKKFNAIVVSALLLLGMMLVFTGCGNQEAEPEQSGTAEPTKIMKVVTEAGFAPFEFKESDEFAGFDMDIIRAIATAEGYEAEIAHMGFESLIPALQSDKADVAIAGMSIDPERQEAVDFSTPYFDAGLIIAVAEKTTDITTLEDLEGKRIAGQVGTIGASACNDVKAKDAKTEVRIFDNVGEAFMELEKGGIDAVINDHPVTAYYIKTSGQGKTKMVGEIFSADDQYGIAVKKGNAAMLKIVNDGLEKIKADGQYDEIYDKWFNQ